MRLNSASLVHDRQCHRIAIGKAFAERQPEFLAVRTARWRIRHRSDRFDCGSGKDSVEIPATCRWPLRPVRAAMRADPVFSNTCFNRRKRGFTDRTTGENLTCLYLPRFAQLVDL